jgi:TRAP-type C4-dicarboxylate transport system permease small subunit
MKTYEKIVHTLATATFYVTMLALAFIVAMTFADVSLRYLFNKPIYGVYDTTRVLLVIAVACCLGQTQLKRGHIAIDFATSRFNEHRQATITAVYDMVSLAVFLMIVWRTFVHAGVLKGSGDATETIFIPYYPLVYLIGANALIVSAIIVLQLIKFCREGSNR